MTEIPLTEVSHACECEDDHDIPVLDARVIPHSIRHASIFGALSAIRSGRSLILVAPHDPLPLLAQMRKQYGDGVEVSYLERGPEAWRLKLTRG